VVRVVTADHHPIFRRGLKCLLDAEPGFQLVGEADTGDEAVRLARSLRPDVLLLDVDMPGLSAMEALTELAADPAPTRVRTILLTAAIQRTEIVRALQLGVVGVVLKTAPADVLFKSIRVVMTGQHWIGRECISDLVQALRRYSSEPAPAPRANFGLTPRELEITAAVVSGFSNREIAKKFVRSENTIKHHLTNIFDKVGASNRLELALFAVHHRLLEDTVRP
jgi:DNA-binding NarL/FixJ family response regulator